MLLLLISIRSVILSTACYLRTLRLLHTQRISDHKKMLPAPRCARTGSCGARLGEDFRRLARIDVDGAAPAVDLSEHGGNGCGVGRLASERAIRREPTDEECGLFACQSDVRRGVLREHGNGIDTASVARFRRHDHARTVEHDASRRRLAHEMTNDASGAHRVILGECDEIPRSSLSECREGSRGERLACGRLASTVARVGLNREDDDLCHVARTFLTGADAQRAAPRTRTVAHRVSLPDSLTMPHPTRGRALAMSVVQKYGRKFPLVFAKQNETNCAILEARKTCG